MLTNEPLAEKLAQTLPSRQSKEYYLLYLERKEVYALIQELNTLALTLPKKEKEEALILLSALSEIALDRVKKEKTSPPLNPTGEKSSILNKLKKTE